MTDDFDQETCRSCKFSMVVFGRSYPRCMYNGGEGTEVGRGGCTTHEPIQTEHTPGPWAEQGDAGAPIVGRLPERDFVAYPWYGPEGRMMIWWPNPFDRALILASPELLEACRRADALLAKLDTKLEHTDEAIEVEDLLRAAVKLATTPRK